MVDSDLERRLDFGMSMRGRSSGSDGCVDACTVRVFRLRVRLDCRIPVSFLRTASNEVNSGPERFWRRATSRASARFVSDKAQSSYLPRH